MSDIVIVDTNVFSNMLNIPGYNRDHAVVITCFKHFIDASASFLLPLAAVYETGNHVGRIRDGNQRRRFAKVFRDRVTEALQGAAPWSPVLYPDAEQLVEWLREFPEYAMRNEMGLADFSIMKDWEVTRALHRHRRVRIWSLDSDLQSYDTGFPDRKARRSSRGRSRSAKGSTRRRGRATRSSTR